MRRSSLLSFLVVFLSCLTLVACGGSSGGSDSGSSSPPPPPPGQMAVTPAGGLSSTGDVGGPFTPAQKVYTVTNNGSTSLDWTVTDDRGWISVTPSGGTLAASASANVTVSINANANGKAAGNYSGTVSFTNVTTGDGDTTRPVSLTINAVASDGTGGSGGTAGTFNKTVSVNGITRSYQLYVPSSAMTAMASAPVPLVFAFHGAGDSGANFITNVGLKSTASSNSTILVGPDAYPGNGGARAWFLTAGEGWPGADGTTNSIYNDLEFVVQVYNDIGALYDIHTKKVYSCGFSRGAGFCGVTATASNNPGFWSGQYSSPFAAYGICAGYDAFGGGLNLNNSSPKRPVWLIHGTADGAVPLSQGQTFSNSLSAAGFSTTWTPITGAPHNWLWQAAFGYGNQDLFDFFFANPLP